MRQQVQAKRLQFRAERGLIERCNSASPRGCRDVVIRARGLDHRRNAVSEKRGKLDPGCSRDRIALRWGRELREKRIDVSQGEGRRATVGQGPDRLLERLAGIESIRLST